MSPGGSEGERRYRSHLSKLLSNRSSVEAAALDTHALEQAIGGEFEGMGLLEKDLLIANGLRRGGYVVDVGCGSGRLSAPLSTYLTEGEYLGTDVVPEFLEHAAKISSKGFRFELAQGFAIGAPDNSVDIVCFFSVFTHLLHEESFLLLQEAARVLKSGGKTIFSFLDFRLPSHWAVFERTIAAVGTDYHHNQFMDRDLVRSWAVHLGLTVEKIVDGDALSIPVSEPVTMEDGTTYSDFGRLGQSYAVLRK